MQNLQNTDRKSRTYGQGLLRYAIGKIKEYIKYIQRPSTLFNDGGYTTFTPESDMKMVLLSRFVNTAEVYLQSDTFHNDLVKLNGYSEVPYWQGSGNNENFDFQKFPKLMLQPQAVTQLLRQALLERFSTKMPA